MEGSADGDEPDPAQVADVQRRRQPMRLEPIKTAA
jgi:hypothetical protein